MALILAVRAFRMRGFNRFPRRHIGHQTGGSLDPGSLENTCCAQAWFQRASSSG